MKLKYKVEKDGDDTIVSLVNSSVRISKNAMEDCMLMNEGKSDDYKKKIIMEAAICEIYYKLFTNEMGLYDFIRDIELYLYRINECDDIKKKNSLTKQLVEYTRNFCKIEFK